MVRTVTIRGGLVHELTAQLAPHHQLVAASAPTEPSSPTNWSRGLRYTSYVLYGLAAVSGLAAIGTWRSYVGSEDVANVHLDQLQSDLKGKGMLGTYRDFFSSSPQLSSCRGPAALAGYTSYQGYLSECQSGNTMAGVATGLWITTASLAALGITSTILSAVLKHPEPGQEPWPASGWRAAGGYSAASSDPAGWRRTCRYADQRWRGDVTALLAEPSVGSSVAFFPSSI